MIEKIAVIGAGTMGNGIAHVCALAGHEVQLIDISKESLEKAIQTIQKNLNRQVDKELITKKDADVALRKITTETSLQVCAASDLVIEAASENFDIKASIFEELDIICKSSCILASNTSSISITKIAGATKRPNKVIGMHFMNPVPVMKLVEIINGYSTDSAITQEIETLTKSLNKIPVIVEDYPGFVANKILMPMINEAICTLQEGVADVSGIDTVMKLGMAHPMGPLQLADFIGLDVCKAILDVLHDGFGNPKYAPNPLLNNMVAAGHLGVKTKIGFYDWSSGAKDLIVAERFRK